MTGTRPRRGWRVAVAVIITVLTLTGLTAGGVVRRSATSVDPNQLRACQSMSDAMPAPVPTRVEPGHASPASPFARGAMWVPPYPAATEAAARAQADGRWDRASRLSKIAQQPRAVWLTDARASAVGTTAQVRSVVAAAYARQQVPVLVVYGIPLRDCGQWSAGGATSGSAYLTWIAAIDAGIKAAGRGPGTAVILEPDALGLLDRLPPPRVAERYDLLRAATSRLTGTASVAVYLDAGHSAWVPAPEMVRRLAEAGIAMARGFALDVSNTQTTQDQLRYGLALAPPLGWKTFVVDTSRNGAGPPTDGAWCNPPGRALGAAPQVGPGLVDAYLWIKPPGESDGACRPGAPAAGVFWPEYADDLARRAGW